MSLLATLPRYPTAPLFTAPAVGRTLQPMNDIATHGAEPSDESLMLAYAAGDVPAADMDRLKSGKAAEPASSHKGEK